MFQFQINVFFSLHHSYFQFCITTTSHGDTSTFLDIFVVYQAD